MSNVATMPAAARRRIDAVLAGLESLRPLLEPSGDLVTRVARESGLHPVALQRQLVAWIDAITPPDLEHLVRSASRELGRGRLLTLAPGNLPIVAAECLILGVLAGVRHQLALSTRAHSLAFALNDALLPQAPDDLNGLVELLIWRHVEPAKRDALIGRADRIVAYGTAETVDWIAARAGPQTVVVPHGPTIAAAWLDPVALSADALSTPLAGLASDVAAFDQRGCRSPHILFVRGGRDALDRVVHLLNEEAFPAISRAWPRGPLSDVEIVDRYMDRLTSEALGSVVEGRDWRITVEHHPRVARPSPLGRTLRVIRVDTAEQAAQLLSTLPAPVGCLATATGSKPPFSLSTDVEIAPMGSLQRPPFDRLHDGRHRIDELVANRGG